MVKKISATAIETLNKLGLKRISGGDICFNLSISKKDFHQRYAENEILIIDLEFLKSPKI